MAVELEEGWPVYAHSEKTWLTSKPIAISPHAEQRCGERFGFYGAAAHNFIMRHLFFAQVGRRSRHGSVRWVTEKVTIITHEEPARLVVVTVLHTPRKWKEEKNDRPTLSRFGSVPPLWGDRRPDHQDSPETRTAEAV